MKTLLTLLLYPILSAAQIDTLKIIRTDTLKPIESDLLPAYHGRYGTSVRTQYMYDGLDVRRVTDLEKYIRASGDIDANAEFDRYLGQREGGKVIIAGGIIMTVVGAIIMASNRPNSDGKFTTIQQLPPPPPGVYYIGGNTITVPDTPRENAFVAGNLTLIGGGILACVGILMQRPGQHLRRAVQYYNRALKQRGISWHLTPYSTYSSSGIGLVGRF